MTPQGSWTGNGAQRRAAPGPPPTFQPWQRSCVFTRPSLLSSAQFGSTLPCRGALTCAHCRCLVHSLEQGLEGVGRDSRLLGALFKGPWTLPPVGRDAVRGVRSGTSELQGWGRDPLPSSKGVRTPVSLSPKGMPLGYHFFSLLLFMFTMSWPMPTWTPQNYPTSSDSRHPAMSPSTCWAHVPPQGSTQRARGCVAWQHDLVSVSRPSPQHWWRVPLNVCR